MLILHFFLIYIYVYKLYSMYYDVKNGYCFVILEKEEDYVEKLWALSN